MKFSVRSRAIIPYFIRLVLERIWLKWAAYFYKVGSLSGQKKAPGNPPQNFCHGEDGCDRVSSLQVILVLFCGGDMVSTWDVKQEEHTGENEDLDKNIQLRTI